MNSANRILQTRWLALITLVCMGLSNIVPARGDVVTAKIGTQPFTMYGSILSENDKRMVFETTEGFQFVIDNSDIQSRMKSPAQPYATPQQLVKFVLAGRPMDGALVRSLITPDCIILLFLEDKLAEKYEPRVEPYLKQIQQTYYRAVKGVSEFAKQQNLKQRKPSLPAIITVFESPRLAYAYYQGEQTQNFGVIPPFENGWYTQRTNIASFSMADVTKENGNMTHVLAQQQFYHTGILNRFAPVPWWFLRCLCLGFDEGKDQFQATHSGPPPHVLSQTKFGLKYSDWDRLVADDAKTFQKSAEDFATKYSSEDGRTLCWYFMKKNKPGLAKYFQTISALTGLDDYSSDKNLADFRTAFGGTPNSLKPLVDKEIPKQMPNAKVADTSIRRQGDRENGETYLELAANHFGVADLKWGQSTKPKMLPVAGELTNVSPLRNRSFCVLFSTNWGNSEVWFVDNVEPGAKATLEPKSIDRTREGIIRSKSSDEKSGVKNPEKERNGIKIPEPKLPEKKLPEKNGEPKAVAKSGMKKDSKATKGPVPAYLNSYSHVSIDSAPPESELAAKWRKGDLPDPTPEVRAVREFPTK
ncbi:MAG: hypothetical protein JWM11_5367 [Planctomycetaceae bacterium]|nr:hypothetical protein [Planctomycetaceae bacterium]